MPTGHEKRKYSRNIWFLYVQHIPLSSIYHHQCDMGTSWIEIIAWGRLRDGKELCVRIHHRSIQLPTKTTRAIHDRKLHTTSCWCGCLNIFPPQQFFWCLSHYISAFFHLRRLNFLPFFGRCPEFRLRRRMYSEANGDVARSILSVRIHDHRHLFFFL